FLHVRVGRFYVMQLSEARDPLWAEVAFGESAGESSRLDPKLYEDAEVQQVRRKVEDSWESILQQHFGKMEEEMWNAGKFIRLRLTTPEIFQVLGVPTPSQDERNSERLSAVLQGLGFRRITVRRGNEGIKGWGRD